jgi:hypothetical protein
MNKKLQDQTQVASAHFYIQCVIVPSIERLAREECVDSEHEIINMIKRRERLRDHSNDPQFSKKLRGIVHYPRVYFVLIKFRTHLEVSDEKIMNAVPWWMDRLNETNPSLYKAINSEPEGRLWFGEVLVDLITLLREYL